MTEDKISYFYVFLAALLWGSTPAVGKLMLKNLNNLQVLFFMSFFAVATLMCISIFQKKIDVIKKYRLIDYKNFAFMGFIGVFLYHIFLFGGLMFTSAQEAFIINYTWPVWVLIFATIILKEKLSIKKIIGILTGFIGIYIVATKGSFLTFSLNNLKGYSLALLGAVSYGLFSILGKKQDYEKTTSILFYYAFSFIYSLATILIISKIPVLTLTELLGITWLGISNGLGFAFWFLALKHGDTAKMSNMIFLTPFISLIYIYFLVGEEILFTSLIGLILIISGILIQTIRK